MYETDVTGHWLVNEKENKLPLNAFRIPAQLHSSLTQTQRVEALAKFRRAEVINRFEMGGVTVSKCVLEVHNM